MAARFWVGGAGTWNATTTHWSDTSGGVNGASVPTATDNVIFNSASNATAYAVTIGTASTCLDITIDGPAAGNVTITSGATAVINVFGSWFNASPGVVFTSTTGANVNFLATTTGKTIATNNVTFGAMGVTFNGANGAWTLVSDVTVFSINAIAGTFDTGNFSLTLAANLQRSSTTGVATVNLGSSAISCAGSTPVSLLATNLTFNAGTSTITCSNANATFTGGGRTFYNVSFTSTAAGGTTTFTGNNTFNNLNIASPSSNRRVLSLGNSQVVTGTLTLGAANAYNARVQVINTNIGNPITLTVGTIATLADVDFRDVVAAGTSIALGNWSGTRLGNGLGNTNITFDAGKTVYWSLVAGGNWSANAWATSSGGAGATANFPLAQDTAIIDDAGLTASNTITYDASWWLGTLNSTRTAAWTFTCNGSPTMYGDFTLTTLTTTSGAAACTFIGRGTTQTLTTNGVSLTSPIFQQSVGGTLLLNGSVTSTGSTGLSLTIGTVDLNGYDLTAVALSSSNTNTRAIAFGAGKIVITGNNATSVNIDTATNFSYTGSGNIEGTYSGSVGTRTFVIGNTAGGNQAVALNLKVTAGTDIVNIYLHWNDLDFTGFSGTYGSPGNKIFYGNLTLSSGMTVQAAAGQTITFAATSGPKTITSGAQIIDYPVTFSGVGGTWVCQDALTLGSTRTLSLTNGTINLNGYNLTATAFSSSNSNTRTITQGAGTITLTGSGTTVWNTGTSTNLTYTTTPTVDATYSGAVGSRTINTDATRPINLNVTAGTDTITNVAGAGFNNLDFTGFAGTLANVGRYIYGNLTLSTGMTLTAGALITQFSGVGTATITSNTQTMDFPVTFNGTGTTNCLDALTLGSTRALTFTNGTLNLFAGVTSTVGSFVTTGTTAKYLGSTTPGTQATISDAGGTDTVTYLAIRDSNAIGGAIWNALATTNADNGNNSGWSFTPGFLIVGVVAYGFIGQVSVWGLISNVQTPNWQLINN